MQIFRNMIQLDGIRLFYLDTGSLNQTILCLHGRWGRAETWYDFIKHYGNNYRIIALDQRGHGLSEKPVSKYTREEMAEDVLKLINHLQIESVIIIGHSMGGAIAAEFAVMYPERTKACAILDKSASGPEKPNNLSVDQVLPIDPVSKDWPLPFATFQEADDCIRESMKDSELSYRYFMNSLYEDIDGYKMMYSNQAIAANIAYYQAWYNLLPKIKCPVMLAKANNEEIVPKKDFSRMASMIENCMTFEMSNSDHNIHLANKNEFYNFFDRFLNKINN